jgi:hypothetical protein
MSCGITCHLDVRKATVCGSITKNRTILLAAMTETSIAVRDVGHPNRTAAYWSNTDTVPCLRAPMNSTKRASRMFLFLTTDNRLLRDRATGSPVASVGEDRSWSVSRASRWSLSDELDERRLLVAVTGEPPTRCVSGMTCRIGKHVSREVSPTPKGMRRFLSIVTEARAGANSSQTRKVE